MAQKLLGRVDIVAVFQEVGGERVAQHVRRGVLHDTGSSRCFRDRALDHRFVEVVPSTLSGFRVQVGAGGREAPLPSPLPPCIGVLATERIGQLNPSASVAQVSFGDEVVKRLAVVDVRER